MDQGRDSGRGSSSAIALAALLRSSPRARRPAGGGGGGAGGDAGNQVGAPLPAIKVESLAGKKIDVASYRGRVLLLDVWASWCGPCKQELPMLDAMARRLKPRASTCWRCRSTRSAPTSTSS